jgi:peptide/nickel transport system ATP-binding protein
LFALDGLSVEFATGRGAVRAVDQVSFGVMPGQTLGIVGESGSGKSTAALAALGLLPSHGARVTAGRVLLDGNDVLTLPPRQRRALLGREIAMVFQDPSAALNPVMPVGAQIAEAVRAHDRGRSRRAAQEEAVKLLRLVGVPDPEARYGSYPHQFSGGMNQRAMIAMAIANRPRVIVADEPTTAVDVTIQAQLLEVLADIRRQVGAAVVFISHDLSVVSEIADEVAVMYAGRVVESGPASAVLRGARHPYTRALLGCLPRIGRQERLTPIGGQPPDPVNRPAGCAFAPRCSLAGERERCRQERPTLREVGGSRVACHFAEELSDAR